MARRLPSGLTIPILQCNKSFNVSLTMIECPRGRHGIGNRIGMRHE